MKQQGGQALIEALIILSIATVGAVKIIHAGLTLMSQVIVEDSLESALVCKVQRRTDCLDELRNRLVESNYQKIRIMDLSNSEKARIRIQWEASFEFTNILENELAVDLSIN